MGENVSVSPLPKHNVMIVYNFFCDFLTLQLPLAPLLVSDVKPPAQQ